MNRQLWRSIKLKHRKESYYQWADNSPIISQWICFDKTSEYWEHLQNLSIAQKIDSNSPDFWTQKEYINRFGNR